MCQIYSFNGSLTGVQVYKVCVPPIYENMAATAGKKYTRIVIFHSGSILLMLNNITNAIKMAPQIITTISVSKNMMLISHGIVNVAA